MREFKVSFLFFLMISLGMIASCSKGSADAPEEPSKPAPEQVYDWSQLSENAQKVLDDEFYSTSQHYYLQDNNGHQGFNYWWNAHALDVKVDAYLRTKDQRYLAQMKQLLKGCYVKNGNTYRNTFYDDMEWWAIACLRAYDATGDVEYKSVAEQLWGWIKLGWSDVKNGGIAWATGSPNSKNACSNAPAAIIAARMYKLNGNPDDLEWSKKIYAWLKNYVVEPERGLVWDAHGNTKESDIYTYNQGTFIGAAIELYLITNQYTYMVDALRTSTYVVEDQVRFSPGGILKGENTGDGGLFKGVFIRYLTEYIVRGGVNEATKQKFLKYLKSNAVSLHSKATLNPGNIFGNDWKTLPASKVCDASVHISGTMLFESVDKLQKLKLLD